MSRRSPPPPPDVPTAAPAPPAATGDGGLRSALRAAPLVVHRVGRDLRYEWVFNAHPDAPGADIGTPVGAHLSPEERAPYVALLESVLHTGRPARAQLAFTLAHGVAVFDLSMSPVFDAGGAVVGVTTAGYDVTPLREAQAALAASEERLRLAMAAGRMGTWEADPATGEASWSEGMWALVGVAPRDAPPDEALWRSLIHPADAEAAAARYALALATGDTFTDEYRVVRPADGAVRWLASRGRVFRDADGRPVRVLGVDYDVTEQRAAEAARRESEARFRHLADAMPQLAFVAEAPPGEPPVPVYYNARWYQYTGMPRPADPATPPTNWGDYLHPDDLAPAIAEQRRSAATGTPFELEYRFRCHDGIYRWFLGRAEPTEPIEREGRAVVQWFGTCTDIHDRKRAEAALRESEERLRVALKHAPVIVQRLDRELRYEWMYNAYADTPPDLIGQRAGATLPPKEAAPYVRLMQRVLDTGEGARRELTFHLAGRRIIVDLTVEPVHDETGAVVGLLTAAYDVTRIRQAESALEAAHVKLEAANAELAEANAGLERRVSARTAELEASTARLRESEERFRLLIEGVRDYAIFLLDPEGRVASWNAGAERIKGYTADEIIGRHFSTFYPPEVAASGFTEAELETARAEGRVEDEGWRVRKDGSRFWASVVITALRDASGALYGYGKVTRDVTERRRLEQAALEASEAERRRLSYELHDDLAQRLAGVSVLAHTLAQGLHDRGDPGAATAERVGGLAREAMAHARALSRALAPVDLLSEGLTEALERLCASTEVAYSVRCRLEASRTVRVDDPAVATNLFRIAQEAVSNAVRHAGPTEVVVRLSAARGTLRLVVADDGRGLPPAGALGVTPGLGLRTMRARAAAVGGTLTLEGAPGAGTTVTCTVPLSKGKG